MKDKLITLFGIRLNNEIDNNSFCVESSNILSNLFNDLEKNDENILEKKIDVYIVDNKKEDFFGIRIFPSPKELDKITKGMIVSHEKTYEKWNEINHWVVEIEENCFDDLRLMFSPEELTSMLLYEMINTTSSLCIPEMIYDAFTMNYIQQNYFSRQGIEILYLLYEVAFIEACSLKDWGIDENDLNNLSVDENVLSFHSKVVKYYGNNIFINPSIKMDKIEHLILWANRFATDYVKRKNEMKDELLLKAFNTSSDYKRMMYIRILETMGIELKERYTGYLLESITQDIFDDKDNLKKYEFVFDKYGKKGSYLDIRMESLVNKIKSVGIPKLPPERDIDLLYIEIDRMENHNDRRYILDKIYRYLDKITEFEEYYVDDQKSLNSVSYKIDHMKKSLLDIRERVMKKRTFDKQYKLFVKVPEGYEG